MAEYKGKQMGGNSTRDGNAVEKVAKKVGVDRDRLKREVESQKAGGKDNLTYEEIMQIAEAMKRK